MPIYEYHWESQYEETCEIFPEGARDFRPHSPDRYKEHFSFHKFYSPYLCAHYDTFSEDDREGKILCLRTANEFVIPTFLR